MARPKQLKKNDTGILKQLSEKLRNGINTLHKFSRPSGYGVTDQNMQTLVLIDNSRTTWPTKF